MLGYSFSFGLLVYGFNDNFWIPYNFDVKHTWTKQ